MHDLNPAFLAYREIKRRIVELEFEPGERLSEARLAADLGTGRSPLRTALARLKSEGWVAISPQSGTFVKALSDRAIQEVTELRTLLEMHATRRAASRIREPELEVLRMAFATFAPGILAGDADRFIELDGRVHLAIYRAADNGLVSDILLNLRDKVQWIRRACAVSGDRVQDGFRELEQIFAALEARDGETAAELMGIHIRNAAAFCRIGDEDRRDGETSWTDDQGAVAS